MEQMATQGTAMINVLHDIRESFRELRSDRQGTSSSSEVQGRQHTKSRSNAVDNDDDDGSNDDEEPEEDNFDEESPDEYSSDDEESEYMQLKAIEDDFENYKQDVGDQSDPEDPWDHAYGELSDSDLE